MRSVTSFVCQECGYDSPKFLGKCPECGQWNSFKEISIHKLKSTENLKATQKINLSPKTLEEVTSKTNTSSNNYSQRLSTGFLEMDTVLGGGVVKGSVILLAGDPGIGKSTLLLQTALNIAVDNKKGESKGPILYISGEESEEQVGMRAKRIANIVPSSNFLLISLVNTDAILELVEKIKPSLVIIDSIQTVESENLDGLSGSVGQVRYATSLFVRLAKTLGIPIVIVGHVTKEGMVAGPMVLSHMVDVVLFLEGEKTTGTRVLRSFKNRFGPIDEVGIFAMEGSGMKEVKNPQALFLSQQEKEVPGSSLAVTMEGTRAFLIEIQALTNFSKIPIPRRVASGIDLKRLELLLAILQKHIKIPMAMMDIFVNVAGGIKISDPACDLAICLALYSSFKNIPLSKTVGIGEVGLLGELRSVPFLEKRVKEVKSLGFKNIISFETNKNLIDVIKLIR